MAVNKLEAAELKSPHRRVIEIHPKKGLFDLDLEEVWRYRELLYFLVWREVKIRYKQAAIGIGWAVLQPMIAMLIFTAIFGYFARIPSDGVPYAVFAFTAILPWTYFSEAFRRGGTGLVDDADLIRKIYFPRLIIPLAMMAAPLVDFLLTFAVLLVLLAWYGIMPTANILFLPFFLLVAMLLALAVALWLGPINVRFRDIKHTLPFLIQIWMYASPVVYPLSMVPERWKLLYSLNPMVGVIEGFRWALLGKASPDFLAMAVSLFLIVLLLLGGIVYFKKMERFFADVI
ncbi:MAG: ABC transporter permease [Candidatus Competibacteraceae bacterium]|nr:ABC transporter permease [Candidatus Competibacteraceae bacterium]